MRSEHVRKLKKGEENENEAAGEEGERQGPSSAGSSTRRGHRPSRRAADEHARCTPRDPLRVRAPPAACSSPRRHALRVLPPAELCGGAGCSGADTLHSALRGLPAAALICGRAFRGRLATATAHHARSRPCCSAPSAGASKKPRTESAHQRRAAAVRLRRWRHSSEPDSAGGCAPQARASLALRRRSAP